MVRLAMVVKPWVQKKLVVSHSQIVWGSTLAYMELCSLYEPYLDRME